MCITSVCLVPSASRPNVTRWESKNVKRNTGANSEGKKKKQPQRETFRATDTESQRPSRRMFEEVRGAGAVVGGGQNKMMKMCLDEGEVERRRFPGAQRRLGPGRNRGRDT